MSQQINDPPEQEQPLSLKESLTFFKQSVSENMAVKKELLALEAKEAAFVLQKKLVAAVLLIVVALFSYLLFWVLVIGLGSVLLSGNLGIISEKGAEWILVGGIVFLGHVIAGLIFMLKLKQREGELFVMTKAELKKDKEWLQENK